MNRITKERRWTFNNKKAEWGDGKWVNEPDKLQWLDDETGLPCLMLRHSSSGHWCGYVGVSKGHPAFERGYDSVENIEVHGGLTYADFCVEDDPVEGVCHIPEPGMPEHVWWLGFDCAHSGDVSPAYDRGFRISRDYPESYKDLSYVQWQCLSLATQLASQKATP